MTAPAEVAALQYQCPLMAGLVAVGKLMMLCAMHDIATGKVTYLWRLRVLGAHRFGPRRYRAFRGRARCGDLPGRSMVALL